VSPNARLALLWVSQVARVLGDGCLRLVALVEVAGASAEGRLSAWHLAVAVFVAPFILLAPLSGCVSNALPRRDVLAASAAFSLAATLLFALLDGPWLVCVGLVAVGAAVNSAARYAMLPAAARDTGASLPRISGWVELGAAAAVVTSVAVGLWLPQPGWPHRGEPLRPLAVGVLVGLNLVCFLASLGAAFPSDTRRPEPPLAAVAGFFRDARRVLTDRYAGPALLALAGFQALVTAGAGPFVSAALGRGADGLGEVMEMLLTAGIGAALGSLLAGMVGHPRRSLGLVAPGATALVAGLLWALVVARPDEALPLGPCLVLGLTGGLLNVPLRAAYLGAVPADARGNGTAVMNTAIYLLTALFGGLLVAGAYTGVLSTPAAQLALIAVVAIGGAAACWVALLMPAVDLLLVWLLWPVYRIRAHGPGRGHIPHTGPLLVVCNHSSYLDPFWLGKVLPRRFTPMMTSFFYDKPGIRWLMRHLVGAIRVEATTFRREAPELAEAVAVLRRGGCVMIFPEAILRRKEEQLLRPFGQGAWHILRELPDVPVLACWIEGGWGSYASYKDGPPFTNKRFDWWRPIDIVLAEPATVPAEVLADLRATRLYLMRAVLACRRHLGLEVPAVQGAMLAEPS